MIRRLKSEKSFNNEYNAVQFASHRVYRIKTFASVSGYVEKVINTVISILALDLCYLTSYAKPANLLLNLSVTSKRIFMPSLHFSNA